MRQFIAAHGAYVSFWLVMGVAFGTYLFWLANYVLRHR